MVVNAGLRRPCLRALIQHRREQNGTRTALPVRVRVSKEKNDCFLDGVHTFQVCLSISAGMKKKRKRMEEDKQVKSRTPRSSSETNKKKGKHLFLFFFSEFIQTTRFYFVDSLTCVWGLSW